MNVLELLLERADLHGHAGVIAALVVEEGGSARADAYAAEHRLGERIAAFKAAGGVL